MEESLDDHFLKKNEEPLRQVLKWWEQKRLWFTLSILAVQLFFMIMNGESTAEFGIISAIVGSLAYLFVANLLYCIGWGIELLLVYYLKINTKNSTGRVIVLVSGIVFSMYLTTLVYSSTLGMNFPRIG
jgi:hypothetical protein